MIVHARGPNIVWASSERYSCWNFLHVIGCATSIDDISLTAEWFFGACLWCLTWSDEMLCFFWLLNCRDIKTPCLLGKSCESIAITAWFGCLGSQSSTVFFLFAELSMKSLAKFTINLTCSAFYCLNSSRLQKSLVYSFAKCSIVFDFPSKSLNSMNCDVVYLVLPSLFPGFTTCFLTL